MLKKKRGLSFFNAFQWLYAEKKIEAKTVNGAVLSVSKHYQSLKEDKEEIIRDNNLHDSLGNASDDLTYDHHLIQAIQIVCNNCPEKLQFMSPPAMSNDTELLRRFTNVLKQVNAFSKFKKPSPVNTFSRKYMLVKVVPLNLFTDDMSGNKNKKFNQFDSWIMVPGALPLKKQNQLEFTNSTVYVPHARYQQ
ncbi:hypothetical protein MBANPS3_012290 [Mucor bainieri]